VSVSISELLGKKHPIGAAERTFGLVKAAVEEGNLRLAVSRGITVVIMATAAAMRAPAAIVRRAEELIQATRDIVHGAVLKRVAMSGLGAKFKVRIPHARPPKVWDPVRSIIREQAKKTAEAEATEAAAEVEPVIKIGPSKAGERLSTKKPQDFPFTTVDFPAAKASKFHGHFPAGIFIPTPGDPWGHKLTSLLIPLIDPRFENNIIADPDGINVYGNEATEDVFDVMTFLYKSMPWKTGIFIPTPGDPGGVKFMSLLSAKIDPIVQREIESLPGGLKVRGPEAVKAVSAAVTEIQRGAPWTKHTFLGVYPLPWGA